MAAKVGEYLLLETIGHGAFGKVKLAVHQETGEKVAVKIMDKNDIQKQDLTQNVRREITIMKALNHRNIVRLYQVLTTQSKIYVVMELVTGGELFDVISKHRHGLKEKAARRYFQQLVDGVVYCHKRKVYHRDLKPENILLSEKKEVKVTDFGLSSITRTKLGEKDERFLKTQCGTPCYVAPEVIYAASEGYSGEKADGWACGVVLYALLTGSLPFDSDELGELFTMIMNTDPHYPDHLSKGAKDLLKKMLHKDPKKRISLRQVRSHPWFLKNYEGDAAEESKHKRKRQSGDALRGEESGASSSKDLGDASSKHSEDKAPRLEDTSQAADGQPDGTESTPEAMADSEGERLKFQEGVNELDDFHPTPNIVADTVAILTAKHLEAQADKSTPPVSYDTVAPGAETSSGLAADEAPTSQAKAGELAADVAGEAKLLPEQAAVQPIATSAQGDLTAELSRPVAGDGEAEASADPSQVESQASADDHSETFYAAPASESSTTQITDPLDGEQDQVPPASVVAGHSEREAQSTASHSEPEGQQQVVEEAPSPGAPVIASAAGATIGAVAAAGFIAASGGRDTGDADADVTPELRDAEDSIDADPTVQDALPPRPKVSWNPQLTTTAEADVLDTSQDDIHEEVHVVEEEEILVEEAEEIDAVQDTYSYQSSTTEVRAADNGSPALDTSERAMDGDAGAPVAHDQAVEMDEEVEDYYVEETVVHEMVEYDAAEYVPEAAVANSMQYQAAPESRLVHLDRPTVAEQPKELVEADASDHDGMQTGTCDGEVSSKQVPVLVNGTPDVGVELAEQDAPFHKPIDVIAALNTGAASFGADADRVEGGTLGAEEALISHEEAFVASVASVAGSTVATSTDMETEYIEEMVESEEESTDAPAAREYFDGQQKYPAENRNDAAPGDAGPLKANSGVVATNDEASTGNVVGSIAATYDASADVAGGDALPLKKPADAEIESSNADTATEGVHQKLAEAAEIDTQGSTAAPSTSAGTALEAEVAEQMEAVLESDDTAAAARLTKSSEIDGTIAVVSTAASESAARSESEPVAQTAQSTAAPDSTASPATDGPVLEDKSPADKQENLNPLQRVGQTLRSLLGGGPKAAAVARVAADAKASEGSEIVDVAGKSAQPVHETAIPDVDTDATTDGDHLNGLVESKLSTDESALLVATSGDSAGDSAEVQPGPEPAADMGKQEHGTDSEQPSFLPAAAGMGAVGAAVIGTAAAFSHTTSKPEGDGAGNEPTASESTDPDETKSEAVVGSAATGPVGGVESETLEIEGANTFHGAVVEGSTLAEGLEDESSTAVAGASNHAATPAERALNETSVQVQRAADSASTHVESAAEEISTQTEGAAEEASAVIESAADEPSTQVEGVEDEANTQVAAQETSTQGGGAADDVSTQIVGAAAETQSHFEDTVHEAATYVDSVADGTGTHVEDAAEGANQLEGKLEQSSEAAVHSQMPYPDEACDDSATVLKTEEDEVLEEAYEALQEDEEEEEDDEFGDGLKKLDTEQVGEFYAIRRLQTVIAVAKASEHEENGGRVVSVWDTKDFQERGMENFVAVRKETLRALETVKTAYETRNELADALSEDEKKNFKRLVNFWEGRLKDGEVESIQISEEMLTPFQKLLRYWDKSLIGEFAAEEVEDEAGRSSSAEGLSQILDDEGSESMFDGDVYEELEEVEEIEELETVSDDDLDRQSSVSVTDNSRAESTAPAHLANGTVLDGTGATTAESAAVAAEADGATSETSRAVISAGAAAVARQKVTDGVVDESAAIETVAVAKTDEKRSSELHEPELWGEATSETNGPLIGGGQGAAVQAAPMAAAGVVHQSPAAETPAVEIASEKPPQLQVRKEATMPVASDRAPAAADVPEVSEPGTQLTPVFAPQVDPDQMSETATNVQSTTADLPGDEDEIQPVDDQTTPASQSASVTPDRGLPVSQRQNGIMLDESQQQLWREQEAAVARSDGRISPNIPRSVITASTVRDSARFKMPIIDLKATGSGASGTSGTSVHAKSENENRVSELRPSASSMDSFPTGGGLFRGHSGSQSDFARSSPSGGSGGVSRGIWRSIIGSGQPRKYTQFDSGLPMDVSVHEMGALLTAETGPRSVLETPNRRSERRLKCVVKTGRGPMMVSVEFWPVRQVGNKQPPTRITFKQEKPITDTPTFHKFYDGVRAKFSALAPDAVLP